MNFNQGMIITPTINYVDTEVIVDIVNNNTRVIDLVVNLGASTLVTFKLDFNVLYLDTTSKHVASAEYFSEVLVAQGDILKQVEYKINASGNYRIPVVSANFEQKMKISFKSDIQSATVKIYTGVDSLYCGAQ